MREHIALELFAGTGLSVALRNLGVKGHAVEIMPEAVAIRAHNGMDTVYNDVWDIDKARVLAFDTLVAGPPCPTFSTAGKGSGRKQMDLVFEAIRNSYWYEDAEWLKDWADGLEDARTGLVVVPLMYIWQFQPGYILLEQVPPVLPIWQEYEKVLQAMGYRTWSGILRSEQYGVPQTRKRAILMARKTRFGPVAPPVPTHSRYHERDPLRLDEGVLPWVSMAEAIGGLVERPAPTVTGGGCSQWGMGTVRPERSASDPGFTLVSNYSDGTTGARGMRRSTEPAFTITAKADRMRKEVA